MTAGFDAAERAARAADTIQKFPPTTPTRLSFDAAIGLGLYHALYERIATERRPPFAVIVPPDRSGAAGLLEAANVVVADARVLATRKVQDVLRTIFSAVADAYGSDAVIIVRKDGALFAADTASAQAHVNLGAAPRDEQDYHVSVPKFVRDIWEMTARYMHADTIGKIGGICLLFVVAGLSAVAVWLLWEVDAHLGDTLEQTLVTWQYTPPAVIALLLGFFPTLVEFLTLLMWRNKPIRWVGSVVAVIDVAWHLAHFWTIAEQGGMNAFATGGMLILAVIIALFLELAVVILGGMLFRLIPLLPWGGMALYYWIRGAWAFLTGERNRLRESYKALARETKELTMVNDPYTGQTYEAWVPSRAVNDEEV